MLELPESLSGDFRLKLHLEGVEGTPPTFLMELKDFSEFSYEALVREAILLAFSQELPPVPPEQCRVSFKYKDCDGDWITIVSTRHLTRAIEESKSGMLRLSTTVTQKTPPVVASPPPKKKAAKKSTAAKKKRAPVTPGTAASPPLVTSMSTPVQTPTQDTSNQDSDFSPRRKSRVNYAELAGVGHVPSSEQEDLPVVKEEAYEEPPKKRARQGGFVLVRDKICNALMELHALGINEPPRIHVALFAGYTNVQSKGFANQLSGIKGEGLIEYKGGSLALTEKGVATLPPVLAPPNNAAAQERLRMILKPKKSKGMTKSDQIFDLLRDGQVHEKEELAAATGYSNLQSKGFCNVLSTMSGLKLIQYTDNRPHKMVQLTAICFPYGRGQP